MRTTITTDSLGFPLNVEIVFEEIPVWGIHKTFEQEGSVREDAKHTITISPELEGAELANVISHEAYHLFYSIRHLIAADEETETTVFGQLVKQIHQFVNGNTESTPAPRCLRVLR